MKRTKLDAMVSRELARAMSGRTISVLKINPMHAAVVELVNAGQTLETAVKVAIERFTEAA